MIVLVKIPERTVGGGIVEVVVIATRTDSVVVIAGAVTVVVVLIGVSRIVVLIGVSGARRSR